MMDAMLDDGVLQFLQRRVLVSIASCNREGVPSVVRGVGFRILQAPQRVAVFLRKDDSGAVLADIRQSGRVAVVFSEPSTHRTLQVKGEDAQVGGLQDGDAPLVAQHRESAAAELAPLGYRPEWTRTLFDASACEVLAVRFTPCSAFGQTPGPRAGAPLAGAQP